MFLDSTTPADERGEIAQHLDEWLSNDQVANYVRCVMFSQQLPSSGVIEAGDLKTETTTAQLARSILENQSEIRRIRRGWDTASDGISAHAKQAYEERLVAIGAFFRLASSSQKDVDALRFECLNVLSDLPDYREIVAHFVEPFVELREAIPEFSNAQSDFELFEIHGEQQISKSQGRSSYERYLHAQKRMQTAEQLMNVGEVDKSVKVIDWLIEDQRKHGDFDYAAKSLCNASEVAKRAALYMLQLDFALKANELAPHDDRVFGHIGDAYLNLNRLDDATHWFTRAADGADREFGLGGLVRVLRREGRLEEAYQLILEVLKLPEVGIEAWCQKAEILRSLARYDDAVEAYRETARRFPGSHIPLCGMAATYADAGLYGEALDTYDEALSRFETSGVAYTAKGHLLARMGSLGESLPYLRRGIEFAENREVAINALASAYRINGKYGRAIRLLTREIRSYSKSEEMWTNLIQSAWESGRYTDALQWIGDAVGSIGRTPAIIMQEARLSALYGKYSDALELVNAVLDDAPRNQEAVIEKTRLLRRFHRLGEARTEVEKLLGPHAISNTLRIEASLLGCLDLPRDVVKKRAGTRKYATREDWDFDHACSVVLIEREQARGAWRISLDGKKRSPFRSQRKRFGLVVAVARDLLGQTGSALNGLKGYVGPEALIMRAIVYWKLGLPVRLQRALTEIKATETIDQRHAPTASLLMRLVEKPYKEEAHAEQVVDLEQQMLMQAA
jgi:tetratricopeptide (TPR) repeat protein